jgi:hypothetical protein
MPMIAMITHRPSAMPTAAEGGILSIIMKQAGTGTAGVMTGMATALIQSAGKLSRSSGVGTDATTRLSGQFAGTETTGTDLIVMTIIPMAEMDTMVAGKCLKEYRRQCIVRSVEMALCQSNFEG